MKNIIETIRQELKSGADEAIRESGRKFFKEEVKLYGMKTATVSRMAKAHFREIRGLGKEEVFALCEKLWKSGWMEESFIACQWAYGFRNEYTPDDFTVFERWVSQYVSNWAACDTLCNHTVGAFVEMHPRFLENLKSWTASDNRWMRRAAAVSLIIPARNGKFLEDVFEIADRLLTDGDDLVQKGYGWMLKAASQAKCDEVFKYVMRNKHAMPRTALRYAIEKMPKEMKAEAMKK
jgi:3-methyladenine DNA glycosylase AlkD